MAYATHPALRSATTSFDPRAWLSAFVGIGGGYALASGRKLWLVVQDCPADDLTTVMAQIVGKPDRAEAIRCYIEAQQNGDLH
jgi:hypothetical protein